LLRKVLAFPKATPERGARARRAGIGRTLRVGAELSLARSGRSCPGPRRVLVGRRGVVAPPALFSTKRFSLV